MDKTPKETYAHGIIFRSKLESKWAKLFFAAGIDFIYEPETFWNDGIGYCPDFYLPECGLYLEVKPGEISEKEAEKAKSINKPIMFLCGYPRARCGEVFGPYYDDCWLQTHNDHRISFHELFEGEEIPHYKTYNVITNAQDGGFIPVGDIAMAVLDKIKDGVRSPRTKEVKSTNKKDELIFMMFKQFGEAIKRAMDNGNL